jgi:hypothetical protein
MSSADSFHIIPFIQQVFDDISAQESCTAGHQYCPDPKRRWTWYG